MTTPLYVLVRNGSFADGKSTPCFQIHRWTGEYYEAVSDEGWWNDPVPLEHGQRRLERLRNGYRPTKEDSSW